MPEVQQISQSAAAKPVVISDEVTVKNISLVQSQSDEHVFTVGIELEINTKRPDWAQTEN